MTRDQNTLDPQIAALPLSALKLPLSSLKILKKAKIDTIGQLAHFSEPDLLNINNFGAKRLEDVRDALAAMGLENLLSSSTTETKHTKQTLFLAFQIADFPSEFASVSIAVLGLPTRLQNTLQRSEIWTLGDLGQSELGQIREIRSIGEKAIQNIKNAFSNLDFTLLRAKVVRQSPDTLVQLSLTLTSLPEYIRKILNRAKIKNVASLCQLTSNQLRQLGLSADDIDKIESELKTHFLIASTALQTAESDADPISIDEPQPSPRQQVDAISIDQSQSLPRQQADPISIDENKELPQQKVKAFLFPSDLQELSPIERINRTLARLMKREAQVLRWRYGLDGHEPLTLEEAGAKLAITRERVRQIQKRARKKLPLPFHRLIMQPLIELLEDALEEKHGVLSAQAAENVLCPEGECKPISAELLLEFLLLFTDGIIKRLKKQAIIILNRPPYNTYHYYLLKIQQIFKKILVRTRAPLSESQLLERFATHKKGQAIATEVPTEYLKRCLDAHPEIEINQDGEYSLKQWQKRVTDDVIVVLRKHGEPLHYSEIAERVNQRISKEQQTSARNIHAKLGHYQDIFIRVGHGIFGLAEWDLKQDGTLANAAVRILHEVGHALTISELTDRVLETWQVKRASVQAAIYLEPRIVRVGHHLYWLADFAQEKEQYSSA